MRTSSIASMIAVVALLVIGSAPVTGYAQPCPCVLVCPAGDGGPVVSPGSGTKSPDLNGDTVVNLLDLAKFSTAWPPNPYLFCADYDCNGFINIVDLAVFAAHYQHMGPLPGYNAPGIDHYKLYDTVGPQYLGPIWLQDQFGEVPVMELFLTMFGTPASKNDEAMCDPMAHQSWWRFFGPGGPIWMIEAQDQFGTHEWTLFEPRYLVLPALKNEGVGQPLPELNHYLCYEAQGPVLEIPVFLADQFDAVEVIVLQGVYFCNPCKKQTPDGTVYPIVDSWAHMTVYSVQNPMQYGIPVLTQDQFFLNEIILMDNRFLAVPALKTEVFAVESSEWNRIKALRD